MKNIFEDLPGVYGAHWGLTGLYPEHEALLRKTLEGSNNFKATWGCKKEIRYAGVTRFDDKILVSATSIIDELNDLVDTLLWAATDRQYSDGWDAAQHLRGTVVGIEIEQFLDDIAEMLVDEYQETFEATKNLDRQAGFDEVMAAVDVLEDEAEELSRESYTRMLETVKEHIKVYKGKNQ